MTPCTAFHVYFPFIVCYLVTFLNFKPGAFLQKAFTYRIDSECADGNSHLWAVFRHLECNPELYLGMWVLEQLRQSQTAPRIQEGKYIWWMTLKPRYLQTHYSTTSLLTRGHMRKQTSHYSLHVRSSNIQSCPNPLHCCATTFLNNRLRECLRKAFSERFRKSIIWPLGLGQSSCTSGVWIQGPLTNESDVAYL